jgi:hypothetical protein
MKLSRRFSLVLPFLAVLFFVVGYAGAGAAFATECYPYGSIQSCTSLEVYEQTECRGLECYNCMCSDPVPTCCARTGYYCFDDAHIYRTNDCANPACNPVMDAGL